LLGRSALKLAALVYTYTTVDYHRLPLRGGPGGGGGREQMKTAEEESRFGGSELRFLVCVNFFIIAKIATIARLYV
jgi:hypothetical protein